jgi:DNA-binding response OmpR family regulator
MRVLVVEDEVGLADFLREGLTEEGFAVDVVHTGVDGLGAATQHKKIDQPFGRAAIETVRGAGYRLAANGG